VIWWHAFLSTTTSFLPVANIVVELAIFPAFRLFCVFQHPALSSHFFLFLLMLAYRMLMIFAGKRQEARQIHTQKHNNRQFFIGKMSFITQGC
jgi:hypothetical protein